MVREALAELARDVPNYADADRILAAARRVRRRRAVGAAVLAAVAVLLAAGTWPTGQAPDGGTPGSTGAPLPAATTASGPLLPPGAVGPAQLLIRERCNRPCVRTTIVLADGSRHDVDEFDSQSSTSLSPDGRWLVGDYGVGQFFKARDLTNDRGLILLDKSFSMAGGWEPFTWSPDSRWLLMWNPIGGEHYTRVDLDDRSLVQYTPPAGTIAIAVLASGELLTAPAMWDGGTLPLSLHLVDPATGVSRAVPPVGTASSLPVGQTIGTIGTAALVSPDGTRVAITIRADKRASGVVEFDLATGTVLHRYELPASTGWRAVAYTTDGIILVHDISAKVGYLNPDTGAITEFGSFPGAQFVLVRGVCGWLEVG
ncbi:hypothetical protein ACFPIJ_38825 [Dactylosporangium cerinum]|uniref:Uncharacterized protein n=1 Tax=Dactylosporangium cerinum TaxID=1434730 RepID=A0ABV9W9B9_9ACTN